jgi:alkylglycerol monooxygenase
MWLGEFIPATGHQALFQRAQQWDFFDYFVPVMVLLICIEALYSYVNNLDLYEFNDTIVSMSHGIVTDLIVQRMFIPSLDLVVQCWIYYHYAIYRFQMSWWMHIVAFFGIDCCYYWLHRAAHEINLIWATHQVHHSSERYNFSTATRQGVFQQYFAWMAYIPLAFFVPPSIFWIHKQVNTLYQFWIHTQVVDKMGFFLEFFLNTPSHHRVHHGRNTKYLDKNYGGVLIIWDRIFGTFEAETETVSFGLVHPDTWFDLFRAQFGHYWHIAKTYASYDSIGNQLGVVFCGPGWMPGTKRLGDPLPPELDVTIKEGPSPPPTYNPPLSETLRPYLIAHIFALAGLIFVISPAIDKWSDLDWALTIFAVLGLFQLSKIFQCGFAAFLPLEAFRVVFYLVLDVACLFHDVINDRTHGVWWSAPYNLSRFSYFDYFILICIFLVHFVSFWFILHHWDEMFVNNSETASIQHTASPTSPTPPRALKTPKVHLPQNGGYEANAKSGRKTNGAKSPKGAPLSSSHSNGASKAKEPRVVPKSPTGSRAKSRKTAK